jgi:archaellum component FlaC
MKNKELFVDKMNRIDGKLKTIRVMSTRQGTTVQDIHKVLDEIDEQMGDLSSMIERESTVYGR